MTPLKIIFEDPDLLVVDKPCGLVVNRSQTIREETLQDWAEEYLGLQQPPADKQQPSAFFDRSGIVHRLDRETSGLLLVAKNQKVFENLQAQFRQRKVKKEYLGLVHGDFEDDQGEIIGAIVRLPQRGKFAVFDGRKRVFTDLPQAREARTDWAVIKRLTLKEEIFGEIVKPFGKKLKKFFSEEGRVYSYLRLSPLTGRTHQIRVHLKSIHHPVVGDRLYSGRRFGKFDPLFCPRMFLHASKIAFSHPKTKKTVEFSSPLPFDLQKIFDKLE